MTWISQASEEKPLLSQPKALSFLTRYTYLLKPGGRQPELSQQFLITSLQVSLTSISDCSFFTLAMLVCLMRLTTYVARFLPLFGLPCDGCHKIKVDAISSGCLKQ